MKRILFLLLILISIQVYGQESTSKPNVLFIMVDDLNDWVGAFGGHPQAITPNIDALAKQSTIFKNAYAPAPLCNPSRTSILTGYKPATTGVFGNSKRFRTVKEYKNTLTLPQYFAQNGYKTAAAGKIFHSPRGGFDEPKPGSDPGSFQEEKRGGIGTKYPPKEQRHTHGLTLEKYGAKGYFLNAFDWHGLEYGVEQTGDYESAEYSAKFLEQEHDKPFFLACGIFRPHLPWYAPKEFFDLYNEKEIIVPTTIKNDLDDIKGIGSKFPKRNVQQSIVDNNKWQAAVKAYLANISFADACVGHVLDALKKSKYAKNTIVVLMGDHGWHLGEKEHWSKNVLWERSVKTPLLILDPRDGTPKVSTSIVSLLDVYPTLLEMANLPKNNELEGKSIYEIVKNPALEVNDFVLTSQNEYRHTLRNKQYRYIVYNDGSEELYDHNTDPNEWYNLANKGGQNDVLKMFRKELKQQLK